MSTGLGTGLRTALIIASLLFGGSIALITILSFLGSTWWLFDYLANYRWQYMWLSLIVAIMPDAEEP